MPRIKVNLEEVESGFATFPEAAYHVQIQPSSKLGLAKGSNMPTIKWIAKCMEGEMEGKLISWNTSLQPQALWNLKSMLEAIDLDFDEEGFELDEAFESELFIDVVPYHFEDDPADVMRNQVTGYHPMG